MAFWFAFFMWLGTSILSALLAKPRIESARPSGLDDFQVPTATEGRAVPIIVGKVQMSGPNVVWYGDLQTEAITEKVGGFLGIGGKRITKAYRYKIGVQSVISSGPIDGIDRVWMGDKVIRSGETASDMVIQDLEFFGGDERGGGIDFTLQLRLGANDQPISTYLDSQLTLTPRYQNICYTILYDGASGPGYIGNAARLRNIAYEPFWYPNSLAVTGGKERIGDDANPICFLFELLSTNDDWGVTLAASDVLITGTAAEGALRILAEQVADEGLGFSMVIDKPLTAAQIIKEIERHVDGKFRLDLTDGRFKIILARPPTLPVTLFDESNITKLLDYSRPTWTETFNEVRVGYGDRAKDYDNTFAFDQDLANLDITGRHRSHPMSFPGVKTASVAGIMASREMFTLGSPIARARFKTKGKEYKTQIGDPIDFSWADHEVSLLPMRVSRIKYGKDVNAEITIDVVEDAFRLQAPGFADPPPSAWVAPNFDAVAALDARLWNAPRQLLPIETATSVPKQNVVLLVARAGGLHLEYDVYTDLDGGTDNFVLTNEAVGSWTPAAVINGALAKDIGDVEPYRSTSVDIDNLNDVTFALLDAVASTSINAASPRNIVLVDDEMMWFETVTDLGAGALRLGNVHRGAFGTIPADHLDNARIWFPGFGAGAVFPVDETLSSTTIRCRVTPRTGTGTLPVASAPNIPLAADFTVVFDAPYAPGDVDVNTEEFVDDNWITTPGVLRMTWKNRNRLTQAFDTKQDDAAVSMPALTGVKVEVKRVDTDAVVASVDSAVAGEFNASDFLIVTTPGEILDQGGTLGPGGTIAELDHYIEAQAVRSGKNSQQWVSQDFEVFGFGLDFGNNFGGRDTGAPNIGVVLDQGAAPVIVTPTPPSEIADRLYQITAVNDPISGETVTLRIRYFDATQQLNSSFVFTLPFASFGTAEAQSQEIFDQAVAGFALTSSPFTVTKTGNVIDIRGTQGSTVNLEASISTVFPSSALIRAVTPPANDEDAFGAQAGVRGAYFVDWFQQIVDPITGVTTEELAPTNNANYQQAGFTRYSLNLRGLTRAARTQLEAAGGNQFGATASFFVPAETATDSYDAEFPEVVAEIQDSAIGHLVDTYVGEITGGEQSRNAVAILAGQDIEILEQDFSAPLSSAASPFKSLLKENNPIDPVIEGPLSQATYFGWDSDANFGPILTGQVLQAVINGTQFKATVAGPGESDEVIAAAESIIAAINAGAEPVTAQLEGTTRIPNRFVVVHDSPGAGATFDAQLWAGHGDNRVEFRIIDE